VRITGRAPDALVFETGFGTFRSGDVRIAWRSLLVQDN